MLADLLSQAMREDRAVRRFALRLLGFGLVGLLALAAFGFLLAALHETYWRLTDGIAAPLLVAATLASAAALIALALWLGRRSGRTREPRAACEHRTEETVALLAEMSEAVAGQRIAPLTALGLAVATGLAEGLRK